MAAKTKITGDKELIAKFKRMQAAAQSGALKSAAIAGIQPIQNAAQAGAPYLTGTLRRSIHTEIVVDRPLYAEAATGTDVPYAARQEFGFSGVDALGRSYHQPARPYMRPAYEQQQAEAISETETALWEIVQNAAL